MSTSTQTVSAPQAHSSNSAATDVGQFLAELDGGHFERMLSIAMSESAAAAVDHQKKAVVTLQLTFEPIKGTHQVQVEHKLSFSRPTLEGKRSEEATRNTPMHVGKYGALGIQPANQMAFLDKAGNPTTA
ncbi:MAG: hypothetical protein WBK26_15225 [Burkholderiaceae bacterium]